MNRRDLMIAASATMIAGPAAAAAPVLAAPTVAAGPTLDELIERHRAALRAFESAISREEELSDQYEKRRGEEPLARFLLGGGMLLSMGIDDIKRHAASAYENQRQRLTQLARLDPDLAERARAVFDAKEAENMALIDEAFAEEEARREACGLAQAERDKGAADAAEADAALALCSYVCRTPEEMARKGRYLRTGKRLRDGLEDDEVAALLESMAAAL